MSSSEEDEVLASAEEEIDDEEDQMEVQPMKKNKKKERIEEKETTPGVVYLSRIPPYMRPRKVRHLLSQYGTIGRVYLAPEDSQTQLRRRKSRGNRRRKYTEGWVEFMDKRVAKATAQALNNTMIGGKKRYYYHDDMWNMKYLPKFRWQHLTEKIAYEQAVHEQRYRLEMSQVKKEMEKIMDNYSKAREVSAIVERKKKRGDQLLQHATRKFKQRKIVHQSHDLSSKPSSSSSSSSFSSSSSSTTVDTGPDILSDRLINMIFPKRK